MIRLSSSIGRASSFFVRRLSSTGVQPLVVEKQKFPSKEDHYAIIRMTRAPANLFDQLQADSLTKALQEIETDNTIRGVILTSAIPGFFSGGIDLKMFMGGDDEWLHFWDTTRNLVLKIHQFPKHIAAAIPGHCPGIGAGIVFACHSRHMLQGKFRLGLNEPAIGLPVPEWLGDLCVNTVGQRYAERLLPIGRQLVAEEAEKILMVDSSHSSVEEVEAAALKSLESAISVPDFARRTTLEYLRAPFAEKMIGHREADMNAAARAKKDPVVIKTLQAVYQQIKGKKAEK